MKRLTLTTVITGIIYASRYFSRMSALVFFILSPPFIMTGVRHRL